MSKLSVRDLRPGVIINNLKVVRIDHLDLSKRKYFLFECSCGKRKVIHGSAVVSSNTKSCGCLIKAAGAKRRISKNHSEVTAIILGYKRHAEVRGFKWLLSREEVKTLIAKSCMYCGIGPSNVKKTKNSLDGGLKYSGIDRVDSSKDYMISNVVPCCKVCNYAKSNLTIEEFKRWAIRIGKKARANQWGGGKLWYL